MWHKTPVSNRLGIRYPIIQGPFGGNFSSAELVAAVSERGGLGSFGLNACDNKQILAIGKSIRSLTDKPFALNLWVPKSNVGEEHFSHESYQALKLSFKPYFDALDVPLPEFPTVNRPDFESQIEAVLEVKPPVMSFIFGIPDNFVLKALKKRRIKVLATATSREEALQIQESNVDIIIASGKEAGGHRASFLEDPENSLQPTKSLLLQLSNTIEKPIVAAGGITTGFDIATMLKLGASGVQLGTVFLATKESNAPDIHKEALLSGHLLETTLTKVFTGRLARALANKLTANFEGLKSDVLAPFPLQSVFLKDLRKKALEREALDYLACWSGQPSTILKYKTVDTLMQALIDELELSNL